MTLNRLGEVQEEQLVEEISAEVEDDFKKGYTFGKKAKGKKGKKAKKGGGKAPWMK